MTSFTGIHPSAVIHETAVLGKDVTISPFAIIGEGVQIGDGTIIDPHVHIEHTTLGKQCHIGTGTVIGTRPQDLAYKGEITCVRVGDGTQIREYVTVHRASGEGRETVVGSQCMLMAYSHVAHNCQLSDNVIMANAVQLGGHVEIGEYALIGGCSVVHQFVKIGRIAFLGGFSASRQDIPPFAIAEDYPSVIRGINSIGLKRRGYGPEPRLRLKKAFNKLWFSDLNQAQAIEDILQSDDVDDNVRELIEFVQASKRGIYGAYRNTHRKYGGDRSFVKESTVKEEPVVPV